MRLCRGHDGAPTSHKLKALGAVVIGTAGSGDKVAAATSAGCDHVIVRSRESFAIISKTRRELLVSFGNSSAQRHVAVHIGQRFELADVNRAHEALESGTTCAASVLLARDSE